eukprot:gene19984-25582_t
MNLVPGPRVVVSWLLWLWLIMFAATIFQVAGMVGGVASVLAIAGVKLSTSVIAIIIGVITAVLLVVGRYKLVESAATWMVVAFTLATMVAVVALQFTPYAVTMKNLADGFSFKLPSSFTVAFAAFGIIGWVLEKGYARHVGPADGTPAWAERAR